MVNQQQYLTIQCGDLCIGIHTRFAPDYYSLWSDYVVSPTTASPDIEVDVRTSAYDKYQQLEPGLTERDYDTVAILEQIVHQLIQHQAYFLHAAVVAVDGAAYAFTAKSGTGKSTHIRLWQQVFQERAIVVNGDKPFLQRRGNQLVVSGNPWSGKERWSTNITVPLKGICFLQRGEQNTIRRATEAEIVDQLFKQVVLPQDLMKMQQFLALIEWTMNEIPFYMLTCNISEEAVQVAYQGMKGNEDES